MKQKEIMLNIPDQTNKTMNEQMTEQIANDHQGSPFDTPMKKDAFNLSDDEKIREIEAHFKLIMETLGLDLNDDSLRGTPQRVAKMFVKEIFSGLDPANKPEVKLFENKYQYNQILVEKDIAFYSNYEHHFVPFFGKAHVAYISNGKVIGLSKLNRIVNYFSKRPQVQERLTMQIAKELEQTLNTKDVAVLIEAKHLCVSSRGIRDNSSSTVTSFYGGKFSEAQVKNEFHNYLNLKTNQ